MAVPVPVLRLAAIAAVLLLPACDDDEDGTGPAVTLGVAASLTGNGGIVVVTDGGVGVTGAGVTLNGTAAVPGGAAGEYQVTLAAPVAAGGDLTLEVTDAGAVVLGTATVPATPVLTAPGQDEVYATSQEIEVTWTSASDPDRWVVEASDGTVETFDVADGAARAFTIPGGSLTADTWEIRVIAWNDGLVSGDLEAGSTMEVGAAVATSPTVMVVEPVQVETIDFTGAGGSIAVSVQGVVVDGAAVTVNGVAAVQNAPGEDYQVTLDPAVDPGGNIQLSVEFGVVSIEGQATVPEAPVVTAPADGAIIPFIEDIDVTWTSATDASGGWVATIFDVGHSRVQSTQDPAARILVFPGGFTDPGGPYEVSVYALDAGELSGPVSPLSTMRVRNENAVKPEITVTP